jgi:hypothetical protein
MNPPVYFLSLDRETRNHVFRSSEVFVSGDREFVRGSAGVRLGEITPFLSVSRGRKYHGADRSRFSNALDDTMNVRRAPASFSRRRRSVTTQFLTRTVDLSITFSLPTMRTATLWDPGSEGAVSLVVKEPLPPAVTLSLTGTSSTSTS